MPHIVRNPDPGVDLDTFDEGLEPKLAIHC